MPSARKALEAAQLDTYQAENRVATLKSQKAPQKDIKAAEAKVRAAKKAETAALKALKEENDSFLDRMIKGAPSTKEEKKSRKGGRKSRRGTRRTRRV